MSRTCAAPLALLAVFLSLSCEYVRRDSLRVCRCAMSLHVFAVRLSQFFCSLTQCFLSPTQQPCPCPTQTGVQMVRSVGSLSPLRVRCADPPAFAAGPLKKIFMKEDDALNFFRRRSRRAVKSQDELNGEFARRGLGERHSDQIPFIPFNHLVKLKDY